MSLRKKEGKLKQVTCHTAASQAGGGQHPRISTPQPTISGTRFISISIKYGKIATKCEFVNIGWTTAEKEVFTPEYIFAKSNPTQMLFLNPRFHT